jgi:hypothetical protein
VHVTAKQDAFDVRNVRLTHKSAKNWLKSGRPWSWAPVHWLFCAPGAHRGRWMAVLCTGRTSLPMDGCPVHWAHIAADGWLFCAPGAHRGGWVAISPAAGSGAPDC